MEEKLRKTLTYDSEIHDHMINRFGYGYGAKEMVIFVKDAVRNEKDKYISSKKLKQDMNKLQDQLINMHNLLPEVLKKEKDKKYLLEKEIKIRDRTKYLKDFYKIIGTMNNKDRLEYIKIQIEKNKYPEHKEELQRYKDNLEKGDRDGF